MSSIPPPPPGSPPPFGSPPPGSVPPPPPPPPYGAPPFGGAPTYGSDYGAGAGQPPSGYQAYGGGGPTADYAGFGARLGARIIDGLIMLLINAPFIIVGIVMFRIAVDDCYSYEDDDGVARLECPSGALKGGPLAIAIIAWVVGAIIAIAIYCRWVGRGQTPGMKAANIRVVDQSTGNPIGTGRGVGRYFASILSGAVCLLGYLWVLWDSRKQTWHDKIVGSIVVKA